MPESGPARLRARIPGCVAAVGYQGGALLLLVLA